MPQVQPALRLRVCYGKHMHKQTYTIHICTHTLLATQIKINKHAQQMCEPKQHQRPCPVLLPDPDESPLMENTYTYKQYIFIYKTYL